MRAHSRLLAARLLVVTTSAMLIASCSSRVVREDQDPAVLLRSACSVGEGVTQAVGAVWLRAKSKEASGQFPANVKATSTTLDLEVTNLIGGTEAWISVRGRKYEIRVPAKP